MRKRSHHYLPVSYLKNFAQKDVKSARLFVVDMYEHRTFWSRPSKVARIRDFYTVETVVSPEDEGVEAVLGDIESQALPVIRKIVVDGEAPKPEEWESLFMFIAFLDVRLPFFRQANYEVAQRLSNYLLELDFGSPEAFAQTTKALEDETGEKCPGTYEQMRKLLDRGAVRIVMPKNHHVKLMLLGGLKVFELVTRMTPHLLQAAGKARFITGDNPLPRYNRDLATAPFRGAGWASESVEIVLPLSPRCSLVLDWSGTPFVLPADDRVVATVNRRIALQSLRFLFSQKSQFGWLKGKDEISWSTQELLEDICGNKKEQPVIWFSAAKGTEPPPKIVF